MNGKKRPKFDPKASEARGEMTATVEKLSSGHGAHFALTLQNVVEKMSPEMQAHFTGVRETPLYVCMARMQGGCDLLITLSSGTYVDATIKGRQNSSQPDGKYRVILPS